jgi:hypothetical protein
MWFWCTLKNPWTNGTPEQRNCRQNCAFVRLVRICGSIGVCITLEEKGLQPLLGNLDYILSNGTLIKSMDHDSIFRTSESRCKHGVVVSLLDGAGQDEKGHSGAKVQYVGQIVSERDMQYEWAGELGQVKEQSSENAC